MKTTTGNKIAAGHEPITGYVLEELIGRGGYGEVWRASAPGGMKKAIKFVYGNIGEKRTEQELKSLERIKGVQHPFILGLERFETVDNQLVVVTELADGSLEDVVRQNRDRGSCGISRDLLIAYMRDVADALDYLHQLYKLQHLDIKPANLLMVGGRVKVADFGLLKDLRDVECSVVGGLTPIYAPPEVFDGKPSVNSDQYSMAVMYQELLTGTRPFTGRTIAQLATQHVHNAPNLTSLPPSDRPVVARALEKSFDRRYGSCSEFVDALARPRGSTQTGALPDTAIDSGDTKTVGASFVAGIGEANVQDLPALDPNATKCDDASRSGSKAVRQCLVIALGGTGSQCVDDLFCRLEDADSVDTAAFHTVFIDTHEDAARSLRRFEETEKRPTIRSLATTLRTANEYREGGMSSMRSMSRRWIYNIPRSGCTEGMRPLGRLAMMDHWNKIREAIQDAINNLKKSSGEEIPGVYVVGSIAGGTGGGMYLDIVHVLRRMLDDAGLEQTAILSLLATSSMEVDPSHPLSLHDSLATLREMNHFRKPGNSYPGDTHVDLPTLPAARSPLRNVYLISARESTTAPEPHKTISDYLWFDATIGHDLLESARLEPSKDPSSIDCKPALRSVGIITLARNETFAETVLAPAATRTLLARWLGNPSDAKSNAKALVEKIEERCSIDHHSFFAAALDSYGLDRVSRQQRLLNHLTQLPLNELSNSSLVTNSLKAEFASNVQLEHAESDIQSIVGTISRELKNHLRVGRLDVISAIETIRLLTRNIRQWESKLQHQSKISKNDSDADIVLSSELLGIPAASIPKVKLACHVGEVLLDSHAKRLAAARASSLCDHLSVVESRLSDAATLLAQAIRSTGVNQTENSNPWDTFSTPVARQVAPYLIDLHTSCAKPWLVNLISTTEHIKSPATLVATINQIAGPLIRDRMAAGSNLDLAQSSGPMSESIDLSQSWSNDSAFVDKQYPVPHGNEHLSDDEAARLSLKQAVEDARPTLLGCGGQQRLVLVAGSQRELDSFRLEIEAFHDGQLTCLVIDSAPPMLIHEAQQIEIDDVISRLSTLTGGNSQVSDRLLTRCDIDWSHRN
ncbi:protein kinase domain-containing protein [Stieleria marina]